MRLLLGVAAQLPVLFCSVLDPAQVQTQGKSPITPELRGVVMEPGTSRPIEGADVLLFKAAAPGAVVTAATYIPTTAIETTKTGANGAFRFKPTGWGQFRVEARKEGYRQAGALNRGVTSAATVTLSSEQPVREVRLLLAQPGEIRAQVVDEVKKTPIAGQSVAALQLMYNSGQKRTLPSGFAATNEKGEFLIRELPPADYLVRIRLRPFGQDRFVRDFTPSDAELTDAGYEQPHSGVEQATPISLLSGDRRDLGVIALRPVRLYRVRFTFPRGLCSAEAMANVAIASTSDGAYETVADLPCSRDFLVKGLPPGSYRAEAFVRAQDRESQLRGSVTFDVVDKNLSVDMPLGSGVSLQGKLLLSGGAVQPDWQQVQLRLPGVGGVLRSEDMAAIPVSSKGEFRVANLGPGEKRLDITGIPAPAYVKEIRYNGSPVSRNRFLLDANQLAHALEVVLDDKPAALYGTVLNRDKPVSRAFVVAVPTEALSPSARYPLAGVSADDNGNYRVEGLPPGDYKVIAVVSENKPDLENPQFLDALLTKANKISLGPGAVNNIALQVVEP